MDLINADCLNALADMPKNSVDAVITDPPYGISLLGKDWDKPRIGRTTTGQADFAKSLGSGMASTTTKQNVEFMEWTAQWSVLALRALKPGGCILSFSAARTYHWMACGMEKAGFESRDMIEWIYGQGMPKSWNYPRAIKEGKKVVKPHGPLGTALKPAHEPIALMSKPRGGLTFVQCYEQWGTGFLNIDDARVPLEYGDSVPETVSGPFDAMPGQAMNGTKKIGKREKIARNVGYTDEKQSNGWGTKRPITEQDDTLGRWPANVAHDGSPEVFAEFPHSNGHGSKTRTLNHNTIADPKGLELNRRGHFESTLTGDAPGSAARFMYCAKPSKAEKTAGVDGRQTHPTVKPVALMRWLIRLACPPFGTVLDPFMGSGTTGCAAVLEDRSFIGIERDEEYFQIARGRIRDYEPEIDYDPFG